MRFFNTISKAFTAMEEAQIRNALVDIQLKLPDIWKSLNLDLDVICVLDPDSKYTWGHSEYKNAVLLVVKLDNNSNTNVNRLQATFVHELHHQVRINKVGFGKTLREAVITEGLAISMEEEMGLDISYWEIPNAIDQKIEALFKNQQKSSEYSYQDWFFGNDKLPRWSGYHIGYLLAQNLLQSKKILSSQAASISAESLLK